MTRPVRTSAIWRGATVTSAAAARSNPADSAVAYIGRGIVASSRLIRSCIAAAYSNVGEAPSTMPQAPPASIVCAWACGGAGRMPRCSSPSRSRRTPRRRISTRRCRSTPASAPGTLPNGLTYFIRRNPRPRIACCCGWRCSAGSVDEADDQRGLAHVLEHMAFNGTTHFKPGELVSYLESIGARFGPHVNAYTSFDETVYMLDVPTDRPGALRARLRRAQRLRRRHHARPRRDRQGARRRHRGVARPARRRHAHAAAADRSALRSTSRYCEPAADRHAGDRSSASRSQRLRDFYRDYYRPDRMAVIVVGDIDPDEVEALIRQHFGPMPARPAASARSSRFRRTRTRATSPSRIAKRRASSVSVIFKRPFDALETRRRLPPVAGASRWPTR